MGQIYLLSPDCSWVKTHNSFLQTTVPEYFEEFARDRAIYRPEKDSAPTTQARLNPTKNSHRRRE